MATWKTAIILAATVFGTAFTGNPAKAEEISTELPVCTEQFVSDFDQMSESFFAVGVAIDSKSDSHQYRNSLVTALNSCHAFVEKYVQIDSTSNSWIGQACTNQVGTEVLTLAPSAHKAECEYLQRLLNRAD